MSKTAAVQAHRGSPDRASGIRENTLEAYTRARALGADGVELDVRLTADGALAVHHDPVIEGVGPIHELSTGDLPAHVPLLADALSVCAGMVVNIEIKNLPTEPAFDPSDPCAAAVVDLLAHDDAFVGSGGSVIITSFWSGALAAVRSSGAALPMGLLVLPSFDTDAAVADAVALGCSAVHLPVPLVSALTVGAAKAILISDPALAGADALGTAKVLAAAIKRAEPDLILAATESSDGYTGTTPVQVAELLGLPSVTFAKKVEVVGSSVKVERQTEAGYDAVECPLPAVVTVTAGVVEPRYPSFKGIMAAKSKPVDNLTIADLGLDAGQVGLAGSRQEITEVTPAESRAAGEIVVDEGEGHLRVIEFLEQLKVI